MGFGDRASGLSGAPTLLFSFPSVRDINISLLRTPEEVKNDKNVFMNQGEWELLHVLSQFREFKVEDSDSYAEMKFYVRRHGGEKQERGEEGGGERRQVRQGSLLGGSDFLGCCIGKMPACQMWPLF